MPSIGRIGYKKHMVLAVLGGVVAALSIDVKLAYSQTKEVDALIAKYTTLYQQGRYSEAIPLAQRVLAMQQKSLGPNYLNVAAVLNHLSLMYKEQGRYADAEPMIRRSLTIYKKSLGPDHPFLAASLIGLAGLYREQGRYTDAEPLYKRSLAIYEKSLGLDHPNVGNSLNNLAELYRDQGRYADAEPLFKRSLAIREKSLEPDHPNVSQSLGNLAALYVEQGRWVEALPLIRAATEHGHVYRSVHLSVLLGAKRAKDLSEEEAIAESFVVAQQAASTAASAAISQLAVGFAANNVCRHRREPEAEHG